MIDLTIRRFDTMKTIFAEYNATVLMFIPVPAICFALTAEKLKRN